MENPNIGKIFISENPNIKPMTHQRGKSLRPQNFPLPLTPAVTEAEYNARAEIQSYIHRIADELGVVLGNKPSISMVSADFLVPFSPPSAMDLQLLDAQWMDLEITLLLESGKAKTRTAAIAQLNEIPFQTVTSRTLELQELHRRLLLDFALDVEQIGMNSIMFSRLLEQAEKLVTANVLDPSDLDGYLYFHKALKAFLNLHLIKILQKPDAERLIHLFTSTYTPDYQWLLLESPHLKKYYSEAIRNENFAEELLAHLQQKGEHQEIILHQLQKLGAKKA